MARCEGRLFLTMRLVILLSASFTLGCALAAGGSTPASGTSCSGGYNSDTTVYDTTAVTERPIVRYFSQLSYPKDLREQGLQGRVVLAMVINADGSTDQTSIKIVGPAHPQFAAAATRWVQSTTFWPGCRAGRPVRVRVALPVDFKIRRG